MIKYDASLKITKLKDLLKSIKRNKEKNGTYMIMEFLLVKEILILLAFFFYVVKQQSGMTLIILPKWLSAALWIRERNTNVLA